MKRRNRPARSQGKALRFATSPRASDFDAPPLYRHMFQEDIQSLRYAVRLSRREEETYHLVGEEAECEKALTICAAVANEDNYRPATNIAGAIGEVVTQLAFYGKAMFEIIDDESDSGLSFASLNPKYVWNIASHCLQIAPRAAWPYLDRKYAVLEKVSIWKIEMPRELGGGRGFRRTLAELSKWPSLGPGFFREDIERRQMPKEFDFSKYQRAHQVLLYRATRRWGWNCRGSSSPNLTEFYWFYRHLTFKWADAVLREHLIAELNSLFDRLGTSARIVVEGHSSPEEILKVRDQMRVGLLDFAGATKAIS